MDIDLYKCQSTETIVEAMKRIDKNANGLVYVVNESDVLLGCVSDGDIRRWIVKGGNVSTTVNEVMNPSPVSVTGNRLEEGPAMMAEKKIRSVAVVDNKNRIIDILFSEHNTERGDLDEALAETAVIIMAGGKGTRLYPYTKILPKPLIPIGDVPILERILNRFVRYGAHRFFLTVNYRKEMIKSYFAELPHDYDIFFVEEDKPLGTAGGISLIGKEFDKPVIITNCDILIETDYSEILKHHVKIGNDLTIVSSLKNTVIPYGVLHAKENGVITSMEEKPELTHFVNTGMYVLNPEFIEWIPKQTEFHMTDLAEKMMKENKKVGMYPISEYAFLDMGEFAEMKRMEERINAGFVN